MLSAFEFTVQVRNGTVHRVRCEVVPDPGALEGPCRGSCGHASCIAMRQLAEYRCAICYERLGFGATITGEPPVHLRCYLVESRKGRRLAA